MLHKCVCKVKFKCSAAVHANESLTVRQKMSACVCRPMRCDLYEVCARVHVCVCASACACVCVRVCACVNCLKSGVFKRPCLHSSTSCWTWLMESNRGSNERNLSLNSGSDYKTPSTRSLTRTEAKEVPSPLSLNFSALSDHTSKTWAHTVTG